MEKKNKIFFTEIFILILLIGSISASNITIDYPKEVDINEEFEVNLKLLDFPDDVYDVKIDILCEEVRIAKIWDESWKSTYYYLNDAIEDSEEKEFNLKIEEECEEADINVKIKNTKETRTFSNYVIKCEGDKEEIADEEDSENSDDEEDSEEEDKDETEKEIKESSVKIESSDEKIAENTDLKPIILNAESIKSENDKEFSTKNLAFYGVIGFCVVFGALFFLKKRKYKNEFQ